MVVELKNWLLVPASFSPFPKGKLEHPPAADLVEDLTVGLAAEPSLRVPKMLPAEKISTHKKEG